jgi:3-hydroxy-9,10-secoandrosta-1,3,5(10)-triene-9,17-dione monooxygenase
MIGSDDVLALVEDLLPQFRQAAAQSDIDRAVSRQSIDQLRGAGVFRLLQPKRYGGDEANLQLFFDVIAAVGTADASLAWVAGVLGTHQWVVANFPGRAQDDVWGSEPDALVSGVAAPSGVMADAVPGGFLVNGTWRFSSGGNHAQWHFGLATIREKDSDPGKKVLVLLPISELTFADNWHVNGLRGTASRDATVTNAFVPEHRVLSVNDLLAARTPGQLVNAAPLYRLPNAAVVVLGIAAPPIGATAGALAEFIADTRERERSGGLMGDARQLWESPTLQLRMAEATTLLDAVRTLIVRDLRDLQEDNAADQLTTETRIRFRRDIAYAVLSCVRIMGAIYDSAGTYAMFQPNPTDRAWRDVNAAAKHVGLNWDNLGAATGRHLFGQEFRAQF